MWIFKKKITEEEFQKFKKNVQRSFQKVKAENKDFEQRLKVLNKVTMALCPLSKQFTELQRQFTEMLKQFSNTSLNRKELIDNKIEIETKSKDKTSENTESIFNSLTQLEQKGFLFIAKLQNESGGNWIPVGSLTSNLYPDRINRKIRTTISNILKKLVDLGLIIRERRGNYWFIRLTNNGFKIVKKELNKNQLKSLINVYTK